MLLPPSAVPHISQDRPFLGVALTASPLGEKPCPVSNVSNQRKHAKVISKGFSLEGGAPRSESIILMIAGGNHTLIPKLS